MHFRIIDKMEPFDFFYHNTSQENYDSIINERLLKMCSWKKQIRGTFFCATLWNGDLPTISHRGPKRFVIHITALMELFTNPHLYYCETSPDARGNQYHALILSDGPINVHGTTLLDLQDNKYLIVDVQSSTYKVKRNEGEHWVNILVSKNINPDLGEWRDR